MSALSYANLIHPIVCPHCQKVSAHSFECFEGLEVAVDDLHLGDVISTPGQSHVKFLQTQAHSICLQCQENVHGLLTVNKRKVSRLEIFPAAVQRLLNHFPSCLFLNPQDDVDLKFLSDLLKTFPASKIERAVKAISPIYFDDAFWEKKRLTSKLLHQKTPQLSQFSIQIGEEDFSKATESLMEKIGATLPTNSETGQEQNDRHRRHQLLLGHLK